ncbi:MAG TPA: hypothetical protein VGF69_02945 [Thermoanaerobaculia bacterium]|jgi:hypothetical protein
MKRNCLLLVLAALLPSLAQADYVVSTPRELVLPSTTTAAPSDTVEIDTATDGRNILAVWDDVKSTDFNAFTSQLYATVVGPDDSVARRTRTPLGSGRWPDAVWTGEEYLVVYADQGRGFFLRRLGPDGQLLTEAPTTLLAGFGIFFDAPPSIVWTGTRALIIFETVDNGKVTYAAVTDAHGQVIMEARRVTAFDDPFTAVDAVPHAGGALVLGRNGDALAVRRVGSSGVQIGEDTTIVASTDVVGRPRIATDGLQSIVVWNDGSAAWAQRLDANAARRGQRIRLGNSTPQSFTFSVTPTLAGFVIVGDELLAVRVDVNGNLLDAEPRELGDPQGNERVPSAISTTDGRLNIVYLRGFFERGRVVTMRRFNVALQPAGDELLVARSAPAQTFPAIVARDQGFLIVYREGNALLSAVMSPNGTVARAPRHVADVEGVFPAGIRLERAGSRYVASWIEQDVPAGIFSSRIVVMNDDGRPLGLPATLANTRACGNEPPSVAAQGEHLMAAWHDCSNRVLHSQQLTLAGEPVGANIILALTADLPTRLQIVGTRFGYYVAWLEQPSAYSRLMGLRLDASGRPDTPQQQLLDLPSLVTSFRMASNQAQVLIAWLSKNPADVVNDSIGTISIEPNELITHHAPVTGGLDRKQLLDNRWDGTAFVITWLAGPTDQSPTRTVHRIRAGRSGVLLTPLPHTPLFEIAIGETIPAYAFSGSHAFVSTQIIDREDVGRVPRLVGFVALDAKRRAVGR